MAGFFVVVVGSIRNPWETAAAAAAAAAQTQIISFAIRFNYVSIEHTSAGVFYVAFGFVIVVRFREGIFEAWYYLSIGYTVIFDYSF